MLLPTTQISLVLWLWKMLVKERKGKEEKKRGGKEKFENMWRISIHSASERVLEPPSITLILGYSFTCPLYLPYLPTNNVSNTVNHTSRNRNSPLAIIKIHIICSKFYFLVTSLCDVSLYLFHFFSAAWHPSFPLYSYH